MSDHEQVKSDSPKRRLAIVGAGSSGLITLKNAVAQLPDWDIICLERSDSVVGCWGNPPDGFTSTSTKYTTQFACHAVFPMTVDSDARQEREEFFCDQEFGEYLTKFAERYDLKRHIRFHTRVTGVQRTAECKWSLEFSEGAAERCEQFDAVVICTGLAAQPKRVNLPAESPVRVVTSIDELLTNVRGKTVVVIGGGESAVDYANRLANPELGNSTFLSLRGGVRVSPRYHPIRGVPSDFLRNRLMLSIHPGLRNRLGEIFVRGRIRFENLFRRLFPGRRGESPDSESLSQDALAEMSGQDRAGRKRLWGMKLTEAAKDRLFNMFHNKSDDFLDAVAENRLSIVGPPVDETHHVFESFDRDSQVEILPDVIVPAIGYRSTLDDLLSTENALRDFYLGCIHVSSKGLYAVGYARPIIGNIPTISEIQARCIIGLISGQLSRPLDLQHRHRRDREIRNWRYGEINQEAVYPVEMFPYCDRLARWLGQYPSPKRLGGWWRWWRTQLIPASTLHYDWTDEVAGREIRATPIYLPWSLIALLCLIKPLDWVYRCVRRD